MRLPITNRWLITLLALIVLLQPLHAQWTQRDHRGSTRGPWLRALPRELPELYIEFNGIDFGHAHLAETLLRTQDAAEIGRARLVVLEFIFSRPRVPPDEELAAPTFVRMAWELQKAFHWAHDFHRSLYDLFAADHVPDKEAGYRRILADYLSKPEALTPELLDHHGALWSFPESKSFRDRHPKFNTQIWAYHWLQAAAYDVQLMGPAARQRELMRPTIAHYHHYLRNPPVQWRAMPMMMEAAPEFSRRYPEAANIFDNLHMLHDNVDDVLSRPDLYPTWREQRQRMLALLRIYLHREQQRGHHHEFRGTHAMMMEHLRGPRPPTVQAVLGLPAPAAPHAHGHARQQAAEPPRQPQHRHH